MSASSDRERIPQRQLGELMTELGLISEEQLATVLEVQQRSKRPLGQIVVELGFASGAAVAHALAMQSGGALRTEYGFALGVSADQAEREARQTRVGLPKLRLAATAVPPIPIETEDEIEPDDEVAAEETVEADPEHPEVAEATGLAHLPEEVERLEQALADVRVAHEQELVALRETHDHAASELERLQAALSEAQTAHRQEVTRLHDEHQRAPSALE